MCYWVLTKSDKFVLKKTVKHAKRDNMIDADTVA